MPRKKSTKMPDIPTNPAVELLSKISKVRMLSPSLILLEIPMDTNTDLPVWDAVRSQQVDVEWTVGAYSIGVIVTPVPTTVAPKAAKRKRGRPRNDDARNNNNNNDVPTSSTPENRSPTKQPRITLQHIPLAQSTSNTNVLLTVLPSSHVACSPVNPFALTPVTNNSFFCPLPLIISQPPLATTSTQQQQQQQPNSPPPAKRARLSSRLTRACTSKYKTKTSSSSSPARPPPPPPSMEQITHTKQPCDIQICDEFLLNVCLKGESCEMHHTPYPFHWQLFAQSAGGQWVDLNPDAQLCLERHYCNVKCLDGEEIIIKDGVSLDLALMEVFNNKVGHHKYTNVRRLSNTSDPARNPHFPTEWHIYCCSNNGRWEEYSKEASKLLLGKMADKEPECTVQINGVEYTVNFGDMTQTRNSNPGSITKVLCRPTYRSPASMEPHLHKRTGTPSEPSEANFNVDPLQAFACWYPPVWSLVPHQDYRLVDVPTGTQAFLKVQNLFHQSLSETEMEITSIQQIQNLLHWDKFQRHRAHMEQNSTKTTKWLERHAFHGTVSEAVPQICRHNFDPRVSGTNGTAFGEGSYFSLSPSYCHPFSPPSADGVRHMFLAKVLVGSVTRGSRVYRRPPPVRKNTPLLFYDSCVDCVSKPSIFVVFDSCQCYPYYLIKYKELSRIIDITK